MTWSISVSGHEEPNSKEAEEFVVDELKLFMKSLKEKGRNPLSNSFSGNYISASSVGLGEDA